MAIRDTPTTRRSSGDQIATRQDVFRELAEITGARKERGLTDDGDGSEGHRAGGLICAVAAGVTTGSRHREQPIAW